MNVNVNIGSCHPEEMLLASLVTWIRSDVSEAVCMCVCVCVSVCEVLTR